MGQSSSQIFFLEGDEDSPNLSFASIDWYWDSPANHL